MREFARWAADERTAAAAADRARERSLREQAGASGTWVGLLVDLAERAEVIELTVAGGRRSGQIVGVGADFCVVEQRGGRPALVATTSMTSVAVAAAHAVRSEVVPAGDRPPQLSLSLAGALSALADQRAPVALTTDDGDTFDGEVVSVGQDVVALRLAGARLRHVALAAVAVCELR